MNSSAGKDKRRVDRWLPIFDWTEAQVCDRIAASGVAHHPAYDAGMRRLSCCFCVLALASALVRSARLNPDLADQYAAVEAAIGHRFRAEISMADIVAAARRPDRA